MRCLFSSSLWGRRCAAPPSGPSALRRSGPLDLPGLLDHAGHHPALAGAHRPRLDDRHAIADLGVVVLVVREERRGPALVLAVEFVPGLALDGDRDRLLHLVAHHDAGYF